MSQSNLAYQLPAAENKLAKHAVNVHKFGGSSLASVACVRRVVAIIAEHCQLNDIVVVSANGDTTDKLIALQQQALAKSSEFLLTLNSIQQYQQALISDLLQPHNAERLLAQLQQDIERLLQWLNTDAERYHWQTLAFGEVWSARLLSAILSEQLCPSYYLDAREFLVIDNEQRCQCDYELSRQQFEALQQSDNLLVVTGYIARDAQGNDCTLGRNGSDYSATIMAALSEARHATLWTDVDGIYSADPRVVPGARKLHRLPNDVAMELGRLGNPVLHAKTIQPLSRHRTHLHVASSFAQHLAGTEIGEFGQIAQQELSVTHLNDLVLAQSLSINVECRDELQQHFAPLCLDAERGLLVVSQSQQKALSQWLASQDNEVTFTPVALLAAVGYQIVQRADVRARFKRVLRAHRPLALLNSCNGHSLIAVLADNCSVELLNHVHHKLTKNARNIGVVVAGLGNIGQRFLQLLPQQINRLNVLENVHLVGLLNSTHALINNDGLEPELALQQFADRAESYDEQTLLQWLAQHPYDDLVLVDITPSEAFSNLYQQFFQHGIHLIGANKWAASSSTEHYQTLLATAARQHSLWLGNTTVGAGLPVNYAINDLRNSGDTINEISGIFSGTLSWLFEQYQGDAPFSGLLLEALQQGITEPDPRDDLSGRDVQRKLLILARAAGFTLALDDIECQNLVPEHLRALSKAEFLARAGELDDFFATQAQIAKQRQAKLRYIARFQHNNGQLRARVGLEYLAADDAFASINAGDNIFQINSDWYCDNPLIIRGPGAGRDVTAGGLHSDLVNLCQQLAAKQPQVNIKGIES